MFKIDHSKFKEGAADLERGEKLDNLYFLNIVGPCYSEVVWGK
jgi:hypothetical protein